MRHPVVTVQLIREARTADARKLEQAMVDAPADLDLDLDLDSQPEPRRLSVLARRARALVLGTT